MGGYAVGVQMTGPESAMVTVERWTPASSLSAHTRKVIGIMYEVVRCVRYNLDGILRDHIKLFIL